MPAEAKFTNRLTLYVDIPRRRAVSGLRVDRTRPDGSIPPEASVLREIVDEGLRSLGYDPESGERISKASSE